MSTRAFTDKAKGEYLSLLAEGLRRAEAYRMTGLSYGQISYRRKNDPEFVQQEEEAESLASEKVEAVLWSLALAGNLDAMKMWLYNRAEKGRWLDRKVRQVELQAQLELEAGDNLARIHELQARLAEREQLLKANVIDVESEGPDALGT